jgi:hypothetical protein
MSFYSELSATALRILADKGDPGTLQVQSGATYDPATQTNVPAYTTYPVSVYVGNYSGRINEAGTLVQTSDRKLIVSGQGVVLEPAMSCIVTVGGVSYASQNIKPVGGQGVNVVFIIQGRA